MNFMKSRITVSLLFSFLWAFNLQAQDPARLKNDIAEIEEQERNLDPTKPVVVLAGSSSVKMWKDVQAYFPEYNMINNGFGGSEFSDLLHYYSKLILEPNPDILFIYEGDNDIASGEKPAVIVKEARKLIKKVKKDLPQTRIILISAKPSVARWELKEQYIDLNKRLTKMTKEEGVEMADVWKAMVNEEGEVYKDIFIQDNLHMNKKGYDIWGRVLQEYL